MHGQYSRLCETPQADRTLAALATPAPPPRSSSVSTLAVAIAPTGTTASLGIPILPSRFLDPL